jgi:hypothetical protein
MTGAASFDAVVLQVAGILHAAGIAHALIGGVAVGLHGYARATGDIDFLVDGARRQEVIQVLTASDFTLAAATDEVLHFDGPLPVDLLLARREPTQQMLREATRVESLGTMLLRVEDIIGLKIQAFSNNRTRQWHDQADIAELIRANPRLDWERVLRYAEMFGATKLMEDIRQGVSG